MTDSKSSDQIREIRKLATASQSLLTEFGDDLVAGTSPSIVLYKANLDPGSTDELVWHAGVVYRQHVAATPEIALKALGQSLLSKAQSLGAMRSDENTAVKVLKGGEAQITAALPEASVTTATEGDSNA